MISQDNDTLLKITSESFGYDLPDMISSNDSSINSRENKFMNKMIRGIDLNEQFLRSLTMGWTIKGMLPEHARISVLYGLPGSYKSFLALDIAASIASGIDWHGKKVKQKKVLYIAAEGDIGVIKSDFDGGTRPWDRSKPYHQMK